MSDDSQPTTNTNGKVDPDLEENSGVEFPGETLEPFIGTT